MTKPSGQAPSIVSGKFIVLDGLDGSGEAETVHQRILEGLSRVSV